MRTVYTPLAAVVVTMALSTVPAAVEGQARDSTPAQVTVVTDVRGPSKEDRRCDFHAARIDTLLGYRLRDIFIYGERATSAVESQRQDVPGGIACVVRQLEAGEQVNALGVLDIYLQNSPTVVAHLRGRGQNVLLLPEVRRAGESNWLRIEAPNRYYRRIEAGERADTAKITEDMIRNAGISPDSLKKIKMSCEGKKDCRWEDKLDAILLKAVTWFAPGDSAELARRLLKHPEADSASLNAIIEGKQWQRLHDLLLQYTNGKHGCLPQYDADKGPFGLAPRGEEPTYQVDQAELQRNFYLREGARVPVLFFFDLVQQYNCPYLRDLWAAMVERRPFLRLDLKALAVIGSDNVPAMYGAREGDRIRVRILVAEQDVRQRDRNRELLREFRLPNVPEYRQATRLSVADDIEFAVAEYGLQLQIVPAVSYGSKADDLAEDQFNPIKSKPAITTSFYLRYRGRRAGLRALQWLPGTFVALLSLGNEETKFTGGLAWSPPMMRHWVSVFYGWHDLKTPVVGITLSPKIDFQAMLSRDKPGP